MLIIMSTIVFYKGTGTKLPCLKSPLTHLYPFGFKALRFSVLRAGKKSSVPGLTIISSFP